MHNMHCICNFYIKHLCERARILEKEIFEQHHRLWWFKVYEENNQLLNFKNQPTKNKKEEKKQNRNAVMRSREDD